MPMVWKLVAALACVGSLLAAALASGQGRVGEPAAGDDQFVNWESPHVHPLDLAVGGSGGTLLLAVNTPDNRLEVFGASDSGLAHVGSVPVGLDPVSVRVRTSAEAWVVNHVSDTISIVDLETLNTRLTVETADEPCDVVFAQGRAFVSCSQANLVQVFDAAMPTTPIAVVPIEGEDPRALAVSSDGTRVYAAVFESGNGSTVLGGGLEFGAGAFPPNVVSQAGPYGGVNPPPNAGAAFDPPINPDLPPPPAVGLIVRQDASGAWMDDNSGDWTPWVSGASAAASGRSVGWTLVDQDVAVIDAVSFSTSYITRMMNACMAIAVHPATGDVTVVGIDGTNELRFEPNVNGRFVRVLLAAGGAGGGGDAHAVHDLNPHLDYVPGPSFTPIAQAERDLSLGDPRAIVWHSDGQSGYVAGMGSNNVIVLESDGTRNTGVAPIEVPEGPTGLALDESVGRLYVLSKFAGVVTAIDTLTLAPVAQAAFHDPSPTAIKIGRKHLYDTHKTSGLGQASCASCHIDGRTDRLAWDLGDPSGEMKVFNQNCPDGACDDWHPMKGPMTTQTLQDIVGKEPHHWRGDREGLEAFNGAFVGLLGDDTQLTDSEMQEFEDFLATIHFPPNPFRNFDNTLPTSLPLPGHFTTGRFGPAGQPMPNGNATRGLTAYRFSFLDGVQCVTCHTLPTGAGMDGTFVGNTFVPIPPGPKGEAHLMVVSVDGSSQDNIKVPQLRNVYEKTGFNTTQIRNTAGFGYLHDGSVDSIERFIAEPVFGISSNQQLADLVAFMLAFSGSNLPQGSPTNLLEPPGPPGRDTHAAVGEQITLTSSTFPLRLFDFLAQADLDAVDLVVKGVFNGEPRGFLYAGSFSYQSDRAGEVVLHGALTAAAQPGGELTWTLVPFGTGERIAIDRDLDGFLDADELDACADPADPLSTPDNSTCCAPDLDGIGGVNTNDFFLFLTYYQAGDPRADFAPGGGINTNDFFAFLAAYQAGC